MWTIMEKYECNGAQWAHAMVSGEWSLWCVGVYLVCLSVSMCLLTSYYPYSCLYVSTMLVCCVLLWFWCFHVLFCRAL